MEQPQNGNGDTLAPHCPQPSIKPSEKIKLLKSMKKDVKQNNSTNLNQQLNLAPISLPEFDPYGSLLKFATSFNHIECIDVLLDHQSPVTCNEASGLSVLHEAVKHGYMDLVQAMLSHADVVNIDQPSLYEHKTPFHIAVQHNNFQMVQLLLSYGADINTRNIYGCCALHIAAGLDFAEMASFLIKNGASVREINNVTWTPLHHSIAMNNIATARVLLKYKADVSAQTRYGKTVLHLACQRGYLQAVELLLDINSPTDIKDIHGNTPLDYAADPLIASLVKNATNPPEKNLDLTGNVKHINMKVRSKSLVDLLEPEFIQDDYYDNHFPISIGDIRPRAMSDGEVAAHSKIKRSSTKLSKSFRKILRGSKRSHSVSVADDFTPSTDRADRLSKRLQQLATIDESGYRSVSLNDVTRQHFSFSTDKKMENSDDVEESCSTPNMHLRNDKKIRKKLSPTLVHSINVDVINVKESDLPNEVLDTDNFRLCIASLADTCITSIKEVTKVINDIQHMQDNDLRFFKITELKTYLNQWALETENFRSTSI